MGCWVKASSVEKTSLPLKSAGCDKAVLSRGSAAAHGAKEKAGSSPQLSSKTVVCLSFPISQRVQGLPLRWMEEDPIVDTVLLHPHGVVLCLRQGARAGRSGLHEKQAPSPLFRKGRHANLACDEPWSKRPRARVGKTCPRCLQPQACHAASHLEAFARARLLGPEASLYTPASSFANFRTQLVYPLLQKAFLGSLVRIKCPSSVFQRPWSLATEAVSTCWFPLLNSALVRRDSGSQLQPQSAAWSLAHSRHQIHVRWVRGPWKGRLQGLP